MGKTAQANVTGFQITEGVAGGHHNPKNPEHGGYSWIFYAMTLPGNWNKNVCKILPTTLL